jgi:hypothetical protein
LRRSCCRAAQNRRVQRVHAVTDQRGDQHAALEEVKAELDRLPGS